MLGRLRHLGIAGLPADAPQMPLGSQANHLLGLNSARRGEYMWPVWVSGATALAAIVVGLLPCICGALFGIDDEVGDSEMEEALYQLPGA